ncbi:hypothetical protein Dsin_002691 [Dipteronia sinensis]|uniref:Uncharacterized protein n=1 Tax=Dipteronia sinensis TaxID=43782 RepID=A0AAE0B7N9_9ROSI|nr:hypothetical protein Dsin_002691 [Dipteronia sinensis]
MKKDKKFIVPADGFCAKTFKVISPPVLGENALGCDLKLPFGFWNDDLIWESFMSDDIEIILGIPCSSSSRQDSLIWHFEKFGFFSVKSAYHLDCSLLEGSSTSGTGLGSSDHGGSIFVD